MFEWILIALIVAAIFYAGDLPKLKQYMDERTKAIMEKAKEKKNELEAQMKSKQSKDKNAKSDDSEN